MSDLVGNPEDRFSHDVAHMIKILSLQILLQLTKDEAISLGTGMTENFVNYEL